ncbi:MAG: hypothetical protein B6U94_00060 [Thermofilum sp. ex4484_79]|nr:MAG: hypothetical protein B6U94_00060 [Thermofilum sp. ex4484_79]
MFLLQLEGHVGLGMLFAGLVSLLYPSNVYDDTLWIWFVAFIGMMSWPDLDLGFELTHRGFTHTLAGALVFGVISALIFGLVNVKYVFSGFVGGFSGTLVHMLGDLFTYWKFQPLWPLSKKAIAFRFFKANNKGINSLFAKTGTLVFMIVLVYRVLAK